MEQTNLILLSSLVISYIIVGEFSAGSKLAAEINKTAEDNYFICVTRHYGGRNLGKTRFDHIIAAGKDAYARL